MEHVYVTEREKALVEQGRDWMLDGAGLLPEHRGSLFARDEEHSRVAACALGCAVYAARNAGATPRQEHAVLSALAHVFLTAHGVPIANVNDELGRDEAIRMVKDLADRLVVS